MSATMMDSDTHFTSGINGSKKFVLNQMYFTNQKTD